jgi:hypothetical protein
MALARRQGNRGIGGKIRIGGSNKKKKEREEKEREEEEGK